MTHSVSAPGWRFSKMHGAGNDFVLLDLRNGRAPPPPAQCRMLADRHRGIGCDQILTIEPPRTQQALAAYGVFNADGSPSGQCGNGARCVAAWLVRAGAVSGQFVLDSPTGTHVAEDMGDGQFQVSMGKPMFAPEHIPLMGFKTAQSSYTFPLSASHFAPLSSRERAWGEGLTEADTIEAGALSMGNPHAVIEVTAIDSAPVEAWGQALQRSIWFPESVNVGFAEVINARHIRLRVYERGVGETLACGSGACAAAVSLMCRHRVGREIEVQMPGGTVHVAWPGGQSEVIMRGPAVFVFEGEFHP